MTLFIYFLNLFVALRLVDDNIYSKDTLMMRSFPLLMRNFSTFKLPEISHKPTPYTGLPYDQIFKDRQTYMPNFYFHYYKKPLLITEGYYQYLYDHEGNRYVDLISGISTVGLGHSHPAITKVVTEQVTKLTHTSPIYLSEWQAEYSKKLCEELGGDYDSVYLCNSGG
jgi:alanine-glyoxylate transaminase / (R)-3-amino-2-methylpropionate-pyruvate transaminase